MKKKMAPKKGYGVKVEMSPRKTIIIDNSKATAAQPPKFKFAK